MASPPPTLDRIPKNLSAISQRTPLDNSTRRKTPLLQNRDPLRRASLDIRQFPTLPNFSLSPQTRYATRLTILLGSSRDERKGFDRNITSATEERKENPIPRRNPIFSASVCRLLEIGGRKVSSRFTHVRNENAESGKKGIRVRQRLSGFSPLVFAWRRVR